MTASSVAGRDGARWLKRFGRPASADGITLLCFHHGGGSASTFRSWPHLLPAGIEPIAVQLPGRADRYGEQPYDRMTPLIDDLVEVVRPVLDGPWACYGASMGARVAWTLTHHLRDLGLPGPRQLFVAASGAPCQDEGPWPWENRPDGLEGYLREMGGTPPEVFAEPELLASLLPTLGADLDVLSNHHLTPDPLDIPIRAFAGTDDPEVPPDRMAAWRHETTAAFAVTSIRDGHFFGPDAERVVTRTISTDLCAGPRLSLD